MSDKTLRCTNTLVRDRRRRWRSKTSLSYWNQHDSYMFCLWCCLVQTQRIQAETCMLFCPYEFLYSDAACKHARSPFREVRDVRRVIFVLVLVTVLTTFILRLPGTVCVWLPGRRRQDREQMCCILCMYSMHTYLSTKCIWKPLCVWISLFWLFSEFFMPSQIQRWSSSSLILSCT